MAALERRPKYRAIYKGRRPKKRALSNVKRVASLVSWPLPVLSCCAGAFLACPGGFCSVFFACFWPLASRSSSLDGRDVGLDFFSFSRRWAPTRVPAFPGVPLHSSPWCSSSLLPSSFSSSYFCGCTLYFAFYVRFLPQRVVPAERREVQCVRWKHWTL